MQAKDVMTKDIVTVKEDTTIEEIVSLMVKNQISGVPVVDDKNCLVGIVTEHDLLYKKKLPMSISWIYQYGSYASTELAEERRKVQARIASEIMTGKVVSVDEQTPLVTIIHLMIDKGIKRVPVTKDRELVGTVSKADVLKVLLADIRREDQKC
jgi:CBS domain-containing protein